MTESKVFEKDIEINGLFLTNPFEYDEVLFKNNNFFLNKKKKNLLNFKYSYFNNNIIYFNIKHI